MKYARFTLLAFAVLAGCARTPPSVPATPVADIRGDLLGFFTVTTDPKGLKVQYVIDWGNGDSETSIYHPSGETIFAARIFSDTGTFHIRVKARNEAGHISAWSDDCVFRATRPPQAVDTLSGLPRWALDRAYPSALTVTDPDGDSIAAKFIWDDTLTNGWTAFVPSGGRVRDSFTWATTGRHTLRVLLKDKGSMVNRAAASKSVNVSQVAVLWYTPEEEYIGGMASPVMGELDGEPVIYCLAEEAIACISLDGHIRWKKDIPEDVDFGPSLSNDGSRLYLNVSYGDEGELICFDTRTGQEHWRYGLLASYGTPAVGPDGGLYVTAKVAWRDTALILKLRDDGDSARVEWRYASPLPYSYPGWGVVVGSDGTAYTLETFGPTAKGALVAISANGTVLWEDTTNVTSTDWAYAPVLDSRGRLIVADDIGYLHCFNHDGTPAWKTYTSGLQYQGGLMVGLEDRIYFPSEDGSRFCCYDASGNQLWTQDIPHEGFSMATPCALVDSTVLLFGDWDMLSCFDWNGSVRWSYDVEESLFGLGNGHAGRDEGDGEGSPLVGPDGDVYLTSAYFTCCVAFGKVGLAQSAWPTYNHDNARSGWAGRP